MPLLAPMTARWIRNVTFGLSIVLFGTTARADDQIDAALDRHILPGFETLAAATGALAAASSCDRRAEWTEAARAWTAVSHLRFGPTETESRAFALAFWPDPRGATDKALRRLLSDDAPPVGEASVAGRGLFALERLLFDPAYADAPERCALIAALSEDADTTARAILGDWQGHYAPLMRRADGALYQDAAEVRRELFKALQAGLQFTADLRLGRPLGSFDRPRPARAEMRRAGRSLANVSIALHSLRDLARVLSEDAPALQTRLVDGFDTALDQAAKLGRLPGGADLSLVARPQDRLKAEALQQQITAIHSLAAAELGPKLGVSAGFNSLDGD